MKQLIFTSLAFVLVSCNSASRPIVNTNAERPVRSGQMQNVIAHTTENQTPKPENSNNSSGKWSQSGDPIDTSKFDDAIRSAEIGLAESKKVPGQGRDPENSKRAELAMAQALFERGFALTEARQYASALGDYRRALKYDPNHEESKKWIDQIVGIYKMLKKEPPKEGEEPPPLPFKKEA